MDRTIELFEIFEGESSQGDEVQAALRSEMEAQLKLVERAKTFADVRSLALPDLVHEPWFD